MSEETDAALELSTATDQLTAALALQATVPSEEHELAVRAALGAYVTALGSNTTAMMAGGLVGVYKKLDNLVRQSGEQFERVGHQFRAYNSELDGYREQHTAMLVQMQSLTALVEERLVRPFGELVLRVETMEQGYAELSDRLDAATDPNTPGATVAMVVVQEHVKVLTDRVGLLTRLVLALVGMVLLLLLLMAVHQYIFSVRFS